MIIRELDEFTSILSIGALARHHGGNYTCLTSNSVARSHHTASLSVNGTPISYLSLRRDRLYQLTRQRQTL